METRPHGGKDEPAIFWLVVVGLFDAAVAAGLLVQAGRWLAVLLIAVAGVVGWPAYWLAGRLTATADRPVLSTERARTGRD